MLGLRQKLVLAFGGMLLILLMVSGLGIAVLKQHRNALDKFLYENWRSVEYGQAMVDSVDKLGDLARQLADRNTQPGGVDAATLAAARAVASPAIARFNESLELENHNITLPGEGDLADALTLVWWGSNRQGKRTTDSYLSAYASLLDPGKSRGQRAAAYAAVSRLAPVAKTGAQAIIKLNLDNMKPIDGQVKRMSDDTSKLMLLLAAAGVVLSALLIAVFGRSFLQPLRTLTQSARQIEQGNLDLVVQVKGRDELHQLAEAFNSMAAKLREYRRTNRAKLVRTQQTTQNAINSLPDAVAILSPDGKVEMANTAAQRLFGLRPDAQVSELGVNWLTDLYRRTTQDHKPIEPSGYESAIQVLDESGGERFFLPHAVPIIDADRMPHQLLGVTVVLADVTHLRRLDEMKSGMLSVVSHELKTPLTSIRMGVHLLLEERIGTLTSEQGDILSALREDSDRLNQIVDNLLDMGRIESGRALLDLKPEPAERLISDAVEHISAAYLDKGVELTSQAPDDLPPVLADRVRVSHVFSNLLLNSLKYTPPGGSVKVEAAAEDQTVRYTVTDTGPGIARQYQDRIFERFFRVPGQPGTTGAGLGLAIAREIVEAHGGHISVRSREGEGTSVTFTLRQADAPAPSFSDAPALSMSSEAVPQGERRTGDACITSGTSSGNGRPERREEVGHERI